MSHDPGARLREEVLARFRQLMDQRLPTGPQTLQQIEQTVAEITREVSRELERRLLDEQEPSPDNQATCPHCTKPDRYRGRVARMLLTRHGEQSLVRRYYSCSSCQTGFAPLDRALGLDAGATSPTLRVWMAHLGALAPFELATTVLKQLTDVTVSVSTLERTALAVGEASTRPNTTRP